MAEKKDPLRERLEELGRMNTLYGESGPNDWRPGQPPIRDAFTHEAPPGVDDEHPTLPDRD